ncbi:MAG: Trk family potassium uptake protein, partial [Clostridia bacterium]|nr:Trk family potassium uptake protein [Clostridia bacterium]
MKRRFSTVALLFLGYAVIILIGSAILSLPAADSAKAGHRYIDCLFTSVSATCVTGLIPFDTATGWSILGQSVILFLIQLGGLGFMTAISLFFMAFGRRITLHDQNILMKSQGSHTVGDIIPLIRKVCILTFGTEALGTALLFLRFRAKFGMKGLYYALFTSVSAFCNAGFDVFGTGS